jgi:hypothetical protein
MRPEFRPTRHASALAAVAGATLLSFVVSADSSPPLRRDPAANVRTSEGAVNAPMVRTVAAGPEAPNANIAPTAKRAVAAAPAPQAAVQGPPAPAGIAGALGTAGMLVGIDPETGALGPPSREFRARLFRSPALDRSMTGLTVVSRPDGSKHIDLQGRFQEYTIIRLTPDGRREQMCVQGTEVEAARQGTADARPSPEHEVR